MRRSRKLADFFTSTRLGQEATEISARSLSSRTNGTKRLSSYAMPSTWIRTIGSTTAFWAALYEAKEQYPEAIETNKRRHALEGNTELWAGLGHAYAVSGKKDEAQTVLDQLKNCRSSAMSP